MKKEKSSLTQRQVEQLLQTQKEKGYPNFKNRIVNFLVDEYEVSISEARDYVFHPEITDRIEKDIEWAQHMGAQYWAELIYENYFGFPKRQIS
ncbi:hypothetical protein [Paenibacillus validus]|uniref:hypothetical protein n=1 Tax=Paenibacillus validus TaxID=44253 RepID=UPI003D2E5860